MATGPDLSVIVIPLVGNDALANCLDRLPLSTVECIVVLRMKMQDPSWERRYPSVTFLVADEPVPLRRERGVRSATGAVVGLIEDTSWPDESWCDTVRSAFSDLQMAGAGGPVAIAVTLPSRYQALGWCEYGAFATTCTLQPTACGSDQDRAHAVASRLPGNNMAFRRADLIEAMGEEGGGLFEAPVCVRLVVEGRRIAHPQGMSVTYAARDRHNAALATRLHHGRIYAASHLQGRAWPARAIHLAKAALLPIVLTARTIGFVLRSGRLSTRLPVLLWVCLMQSAWTLGEAIGALTGAGNSLEEWR